jgi:hypothetical protein
MSLRSLNHSHSACNSNGADVVAAYGPLQLIAASLLTCHEDSKQVIHQACTLLETSKAFSLALQGCRGLLPVKFGPPASAEAGASFAGESSTSTAETMQHYLLVVLHATCSEVDALLRR